MRVHADDMKKFGRAVPPAPAPIEPQLPASEEAALIAKDAGTDPLVAARKARVLALLRRSATPEGADAELIVLLARARALPLDRRADRLSARQRLFGIGASKSPPPEVQDVMRRLGVPPGDGTAFADALLPPNRDIGDFHESGAGMYDTN
jgi:hypothetical protein